MWVRACACAKECSAAEQTDSVGSRAQARGPTELRAARQSRGLWAARHTTEHVADNLQEGPTRTSGPEDSYRWRFRCSVEFQWFLMALSVLPARCMYVRRHRCLTGATDGMRYDEPPWKALGDLSPAIAKSLLRLNNHLVLLRTPRLFLNRRVELILEAAQSRRKPRLSKQ